MFVAQYKQAAHKADPELAKAYPPSRAQLHRWVTGQLRRLPHVDNCRVLEAMFPGWTAEQLFAPCPPELLAGDGHTRPTHLPDATAPPEGVASSVAALPVIIRSSAPPSKGLKVLRAISNERRDLDNRPRTDQLLDSVEIVYG